MGLLGVAVEGFGALEGLGVDDVAGGVADADFDRGVGGGGAGDVDVGVGHKVIGRGGAAVLYRRGCAARDVVQRVFEVGGKLDVEGLPSSRISSVLPLLLSQKLTMIWLANFLSP